MRSRLIVLAIAASLALVTLAAAAAPPQDGSAAVDRSEVELLKAQLAVLQAKVDALERRAGVQPDTGAGAIGGAAATGVVVTGGKTGATLEPVASHTMLSGKMFFDFTRISDRNSDRGTSDRSGVGLDVKRFYLGVDHAFNDIWSANLTTDFNYSASDGRTSVFVKKAYVQGRFDDAAVLRVGSSDMPWIPLVDQYSGFRYVESSMTDRLKYSNSADWGLHLGGEVGAGMPLSYAVSVVNGNGYQNPGRSKGVDYEGRVGFVPFANMVVALGGYRGHRGQETQNVPAMHVAERGDVMLAYASKAFRLGAEYFAASNWNNVLDPLAGRADGYSLWGSVAVADNVNLFARYDSARLSKSLDNDARDIYYHAGVEYQVTRGFKLAGVWKHGDGHKSVALPLPPHVQSVRTNEVGVFGEVAF